MARKPSGDRVLLKLLREIAQPVFLLDTAGKVRYANPALGAWLGTAAERLLGQKCVFGGDPAEGGGRNLLAPPPDVPAGKAVVRPAPRLGGETEADQILYLPLGAAGEPEEILGVVFTAGVRFAAESPPESAALHARVQELALQLGSRRQAAPLLGDSPVARRLRDQVRAAAEARSRTLILARPGGGGEAVARSIFPALRTTTGGTLVPVACPLTDAESFQSITAGFLRRRNEPVETRPAAMLLLEVDRLARDAQQELAGFLQMPNLEWPIIAVASRSLSQLAARGKFREDLAERLSVIVIRLPRLRERTEDIPLLAQFFLEESAVSRSGFTSRALDELVGYEWPGELNELREVVRFAAERGAGGLIDVADLPDKLRHASAAAARPPREDEPIVLDDFLAQVEKEVVARALARSRGNKSKAAELLGVNRGRLLRRLAQLGLAGAGEEIVFEPLPDEPTE